MRLIAIASTIFTLALTFVVTGGYSANAMADQVDRKTREGREIFRYDTFGDEQLWTKVLRMHEVIETVSPATALAVGLKVDVEALPAAVVEALKAGKVNLNDPAVTLELLRLNSVVGVMGKVGAAGRLESVGITCALCHSSVDNSFAKGIGKRLDGWANTDLDVGAIVIPPIYGLKQVGFETFTADGPISYWNSYVGVTQMGGQGTFQDPRIGLNIVQEPDLVTPKLPALLAYQLSLRAPSAPKSSFDQAAASRGKRIFRNEAQCATCHTGPALTDVLSGDVIPLLHEPSEVGTEPMYARRTATKKYRTTPLRALFQHAPYFHDGSARDLPAVVEHYNRHFSLNLTPAQKADLVEFLKSL